MKRNGKLITFEGIEGGGKTTQIQLAGEWLRSQLGGPAASVVLTREPGGTALGQGVRQWLLDRDAPPLHESTELLLFAADRAQHVAEVLRPQLARGALVLCDRYTDSTVAYQGYGRGLSLEAIAQLNRIATGGLKSDLTVWLDVEVEIGLERARARGRIDRIEQSDREFYRRVREGFAALAAEEPARVVRIDANGSPDSVRERVGALLGAKLSEWKRPISLAER